MKKALWEYVWNAGWKAKTGLNRLFGKKTTSVMPVDDMAISFDQSDAGNEPSSSSHQEMNEKQAYHKERDGHDTNGTEQYQDDLKKQAYHEKRAREILDELLNGLSLEAQRIVLNKERDYQDEFIRKYPGDEWFRLRRLAMLQEVDKREKALLNERSDSPVMENESLKSSVDGRDESAVVHDSLKPVSEPKQSNNMDRWVRSEANFQAYMAKKRAEQTAGILNQTVSVASDGVALSPFGQMLFGDKKPDDKPNTNEEQSNVVGQSDTGVVAPLVDDMAEDAIVSAGEPELEVMPKDKPEPKDVSENIGMEDERASKDLSDDNDSRIEDNFSESDFSVKDSAAKTNKYQPDGLLTDVPFDVIQTGLTPTQQTVVKAGVVELTARAAQNEQMPVVLKSAPKAGLKELIHQVGNRQSQLMEKAKKRLENEPAGLSILPKRRRKKPMKNMLRQVVSTDNGVQVVETKSEKGQVIQDGKITRTIHIQQLKTDILMTETSPAPKQVRQLQSASVPVSQKGKTVKKTVKPVRKKRAGIKRGVNMERMSMVLRQFKDIQK